MIHQNYFVYILTNDDRHTVLYIGVTNELERRANEHSLGRGSAFARQYNAHKLIYFEAYSDPRKRDRARKTAQELEPAEERSADRASRIRNGAIC